MIIGGYIMFIAIIDCDQGENQRNPTILADDDGNVMKFESVEDIEDIHITHQLNVYTWWAFNMDSGESECLYLE